MYNIKTPLLTANTNVLYTFIRGVSVKFLNKECEEKENNNNNGEQDWILSEQNGCF